MRAAAPRKRVNAVHGSRLGSASSASRSISSRMSSKIARTSASLVGKRRYSVPLPTPARRAISSTPTSSPASANAVRAASRTRARLRAASARSGRAGASIDARSYAHGCGRWARSSLRMPVSRRGPSRGTRRRARGRSACPAPASMWASAASSRPGRLVGPLGRSARRRRRRSRRSGPRAGSPRRAGRAGSPCRPSARGGSGRSLSAIRSSGERRAREQLGADRRVAAHGRPLLGGERARACAGSRRGCRSCRRRAAGSPARCARPRASLRPTARASLPQSRLMRLRCSPVSLVALLGGEAEALEHLELRLAQLQRALRRPRAPSPPVGRGLAAPAGLEGVADEDGAQRAERERQERADDRDDDAVLERELRCQRDDRRQRRARPRSCAPAARRGSAAARRGRAARWRANADRGRRVAQRVAVHGGPDRVGLDLGAGHRLVAARRRRRGGPAGVGAVAPTTTTLPRSARAGTRPASRSANDDRRERPGPAAEVDPGVRRASNAEPAARGRWRAALRRRRCCRAARSARG